MGVNVFERLFLRDQTESSFHADDAERRGKGRILQLVGCLGARGHRTTQPTQRFYPAFSVFIRVIRVERTPRTGARISRTGARASRSASPQLGVCNGVQICPSTLRKLPPRIPRMLSSL